MAAKKKNSYEQMMPVLVGVVVLLAFGFGVLWQKVNDLEQGTTVRTVNNAADSGQVVDSGSGNVPTDGKLTQDQINSIPEVTNSDYIRGNKNADVFIVEYSDLECPFCSSFHETAKQALDEYGDQIGWVYRHFPLDTIHPNARTAAIGAECAGDLGGETAYWNFIDAIFADQTQITNLNGVATSIGLSGSAFDSCLSSDKFADKVESQYQGGIEAGVRGTPGNFVITTGGEGWNIPGAVPFAQLKPTLDEALAS